MKPEKKKKTLSERVKTLIFVNFCGSALEPSFVTGETKDAFMKVKSFH